MSEVSEIAQRVISELEELRVENVIAMLNTILTPKGNPSEVEQLQFALRELMQAGLIEMGMERFHPHDEAVLQEGEGLALIDGLATVFRYDFEEKLWTLRDGDMLKDRYPIILATAEGVEEGFRILSERGYQWWRTDPVG